jgi:formyltetrahydrofolate deformylase
VKQIATVTVIGRDKTGVVARITNFLFEQHANIEALEEQVTRGQFSMTLQASWSPTACRRTAIVEGLQKFAETLGMEINIRFTEPNRRQRMAMMVTKEPHCAQAIMSAVKQGKLKTDAAVMISNYRELAPLGKDFKIPFEYVPWNERASAEKRTLALLRDYEVDFIVLARFMKILSPNFVWRYKNKIINVHPSLLPSFPGPQAYRQAYEHGVKVAGCTAHFVNMHLDEGPIIAQSSFAVRPGMTLREIVETGQKLEAQVLLKAVKRYLSKHLDVYWGTVNEV